MSVELGGQVLQILLLAVILACALIGSNRGLMLGIYSMVKNILIIAVSIGLAPVIARRLPDTVVAKIGVAYVAAFVVCVIIFNLIARLIKVFDEIPALSGLNRLGGALLGVIVGFFMVWVILAVLGSLQEYSWCKPIVEAARQNRVVMWLQDCSPLPMVLKSLGFPII